MSSASYWRDLPVYKTLLLEKFEQVKSVSNSMILDYMHFQQTNNFSYRILLPRDKENNQLAKKLGLSLQLEFTSQLRKRKLKTKMKEIKYIHDTKHFGWIITNCE
ncbi:MAG TPA: hypothetical protein VFU79_08700 [Nitrososphaeraceae archaeon]|jgi:hypothetical protein|nr:hypothetical protein [Nitrososphaeraceae archaeon]